MADWPELDMLKRKLDVKSIDFDDDLELTLAAAIEQVQHDVGEEVDEPTFSLARAAFELAVKLASTEGESDVASVAARLPKYQRLMKGQRVRFGVA